MHGLLVAARPLYLGGGLLLYALGAALAAGPRDRVGLALGTLVVVLVHVLTHWVNDAEDVVTDAESDPTALTGGSRAIQRGLVTPRRLLIGSAWLAALVGATGLVDLARGDRLGAALHLAILLFGYAYSGRPFMLGRRGLSEVDAALVMGVLVPLAGAHAGGGITRTTGALVAVLFVETVFARLCTAFPDLAPDRATGKRTIPAMVGERGSVVAFVLVAVLVVAIGLGAASSLPSPALQRVRAVVVALAPLAAAIAIASGLSARRRIVTPLIGVVGYGTSQALLLASAWTG